MGLILIGINDSRLFDSRSGYEISLRPSLHQLLKMQCELDSRSFRMHEADWIHCFAVVSQDTLVSFVVFRQW